MLLGALAVPMLTWSTSGYAVVPAIACAALGLLLAVAGRPAWALAWVGLALATRVECGVFVPIVLLLSGGERWRAPRTQWVVAFAVLGVELALLGAKDSGMPGLPVMDVALENLANVPLGGPWFSWPVLVLAAGVVMAACPDRLRGWMGAVWGLGALASVLQISSVLDLGARHFLPPTLLMVPVVAAALARDPRARISSALGLVLVAALAVGAARELADARHQLVAEDPGVLPRWTRLADAGPSGPPASLVDPACLLAVPEGRAVHPAAVDAFDVGIVHEARAALDAGRCVQWAVRPGTRFAGDTQLEYLDRAVRTLRLEPLGWLTLPDGRRWILMQSRP
mgnify:CR=1 FL=1